MDRWRRAIAGGLAGTVAMLVLLLLAETEARFELGIGALVARYVHLEASPLVGLVVFFLVGVFVWPVVFVLVDSGLARLPLGDDPAVRGLVFGLGLWVVFLALAWPGYAGAVSVLVYGFTLFAHLVYGFTLGAVTDSLAFRPATPE